MSQIINAKIPYFGDDYMACSESTLRYLIENGVVDLPKEAIKLMTGMHGNIDGETNRYANCGAVNGAIAAIGAKYGRTDYTGDNKTVFRLVEEFLTAFENRFHSIKCQGLVGDNDMASFEQQYKCSEYVLFAAATVERLFKEEEERRAKAKEDENK